MPPDVAHRVIEISGFEGQLAFQTKGDNSGIDPFIVPAGNVHGIIIKNLGPIGRLILLLTSKKVLMYVGLPAGSFVIILFISMSLSPKKPAEAPSPTPTIVADGRGPIEIDKELDRLAEAIAEYAIHLKSHTRVVQNIGDASHGLHNAVNQQNGVLKELTTVVGQL